jgi:hypothetical protein
MSADAPRQNRRIGQPSLGLSARRTPNNAAASLKIAMRCFSTLPDNASFVGHAGVAQAGIEGPFAERSKFRITVGDSVFLVQLG